MLIYAYVGAGMRLLMLRIARGEKAPLSTLFAGGKYYVPLLVGGILFTLLTALGFLALFIGAVVVALFFWPCRYLIVDRNMGVVESFNVAAKITAGNRLAVLATYLAAVILGSVFTGLIGTFAGLIGFVAGVVLRDTFLLPAVMFIGGLVFIPYLLLLPAVIYLSMTGQPTAEPLPE